MSGPRDTIRGRLGTYKSRRFLEAVSAALYECADAARTEAHVSISRGSASGKRGGKHQHTASAPGQPPNRDTGHLQAGLEVFQPKPLIARVTSNAAYSAALEFGTSRMAERPFMRPARDKTLPKAQKILNRRVRAAVQTLKRTTR